jgi:AraC family transcriptional regulator of arabinose operon
MKPLEPIFPKPDVVQHMLNPQPILAGMGTAPRGCCVDRPDGVPAWALNYVTGGGVWFRTLNGRFVAYEGDFVAIKPGETHLLGTDDISGYWSGLWVAVHPAPHWLELLDWPQEGRGHLRLRLDDRDLRRRVVAKMREIVELTTSGRRHALELSMNAFEAILLWCDTANPKTAPTMDSRLRCAMEFMCQNLSDSELTVESVAEACDSSASHLTRLFRTCLGTSPIEFLERERMKRAVQLLDLTALTVEDIAYKVGFENHCYFSSRFKQVIGVSPRDYRIQHRPAELTCRAADKVSPEPSPRIRRGTETVSSRQRRSRARAYAVLPTILSSARPPSIAHGSR